MVTRGQVAWPASGVAVVRALASLLILGILIGGGTARADEERPRAGRVAVSIIIDDLGNQLDHDLRAVNLPGAVTCAFLPHAPYTRRLAEHAHGQGKEVMLHLPMQAVAPHPLGSGGLLAGMSKRQFIHTVRADLHAVPHVRGVNNHMGSLLTQSRGQMRWLMQELRRHPDLYFVDSHTTSLSVAREVAVSHGVPSLKRDVFLDAEPGYGFIERQFARLLALAREHGSALAIAHPHRETLAYLATRLPGLAAQGVELLPVSGLIRRRGRGHPAAMLAEAVLRSQNIADVSAAGQAAPGR